MDDQASPSISALAGRVHHKTLELLTLIWLQVPFCESSGPRSKVVFCYQIHGATAFVTKITFLRHLVSICAENKLINTTSIHFVKTL